MNKFTWLVVALGAATGCGGPSFELPSGAAGAALGDAGSGTSSSAVNRTSSDASPIAVVDGASDATAPDGAGGTSADGALAGNADGAPPPSDAAVSDAAAPAADAATADAVAPPPSDAGPDASAPVEGGLPPGSIACGTSVCNETTQYCCVQPNGAAACLENGRACVGGAARTCARTADCPASTVCCFDFSTTPASASCHNDCGGGGGLRVQACQSQSDCVDGTCATHACVSGGAIESCDGFSPECP